MMTVEQRNAYQALITAADGLRSVLITSAADQTPAEIFVHRVAQAVEAIDRAYAAMFLVGSEDAVAAAGYVKQGAEKILTWCNTPNPAVSLGTLASEYGLALDAFARLAHNEAGT